MSALFRGNRMDRGSLRRPPLTDRRFGHGHSRSYVPHHVKHPEKYTCYVLDEPLLVGGGDSAADAGNGSLEQEKVRRSSRCTQATRDVLKQTPSWSLQPSCELLLSCMAA